MLRILQNTHFARTSGKAGRPGTRQLGRISALMDESKRGNAVLDEVLCKHGSQLFLKQSTAEKPALITFSSLILLFFPAAFSFSTSFFFFFTFG